MFDSQKIAFENFVLGYKHRLTVFMFLQKMDVMLVKTTNEK